MKKTNLIFSILIFTIMLSYTIAQDSNQLVKREDIPWDNYVEWWYFNGALLLEDQQQSLSFPFVFLVAHEQRFLSIDQPPRHVFLTLFINYLESKPYSLTDFYAFSAVSDNINNYLNPSINNFFYFMPNKNTKINKENNTFFIDFKSNNENEILMLQATPINEVPTSYCDNSFQINPNIPLRAYNYPIIKYKGTISINKNKYNVISGIGFFDYNAWAVGWTKSIKEWLWLFVYSNDIQMTLWAFNTSKFRNYDIRALNVLDPKTNSTKNYCDEKISIEFKEFENPDLATFTIKTDDLEAKIETILNKQYLLVRPEYTDDIHFTEIKIKYNNKTYYGFSFIEFLNSLMFPQE